jgi:hypothetical protein
MSKSRTTINPDRYYDLTARYVCGQVHRTIHNLKGSEIAKAKRAIRAEAEEGERLLYSVVDRGATQQTTKHVDVLYVSTPSNGFLLSAKELA